MSSTTDTSAAPNPSPKDRRFPFPAAPTGWFVVAQSTEIPPGQVVKLHYFGRDLVAYRGESGRVYVTDAYCPHLGAHLGHGGKIEGETIRCPFHGWRFEGDGRCVDVPYSDKVPPKVKLGTFPVHEHNGLVHVFHDPAGGPAWELPELDEEGWTPARIVHWRGLRTHVQEVFENTVDMAHIGPIHAGRGARILGKPAISGTTMQVDLEFQAPGDVVGMPDQINDVHLNVTMRGLGWVVVQTHVRNVDVRARQRIHATPVDEDLIDIRGVVHVRETGDPKFTEELAEIFYRAYVEDFAKDFPIWENKRYLTRPVLAKGDGPVGLYRRWCEQFYPRGSSREGVEEPAPVIPDVPVSALRTGRVQSLFEPVKQRVVGTAQLLFAAARERLPEAARARFPWGERGAETAGTAVDDSPAGSHDRDAPSTSGSGTPGATASSARTSMSGAAPRQDPSAILVSSADEYFETLERRFVPAAAAGVDAVFQWELGGEGGCVFHAHVRDGHIDVRRGAHQHPTVALVLPATDYVRVVNGELDGMRAFTTGGGKVRGSIAAAMKMRSLFPARSTSA